MSKKAVFGKSLLLMVVALLLMSSASAVVDKAQLSSVRVRFLPTTPVLYGTQLFFEGIGDTFSDDLAAKHAVRRLKEAEYLASQGNVDKSEEVLERFDNTLSKVSSEENFEALRDEQARRKGLGYVIREKAPGRSDNSPEEFRREVQDLVKDHVEGRRSEWGNNTEQGRRGEDGQDFQKKRSGGGVDVDVK